MLAPLWSSAGDASMRGHRYEKTNRALSTTAVSNWRRKASPSTARPNAVANSASTLLDVSVISLTSSQRKNASKVRDLGDLGTVPLRVRREVLARLARLQSGPEDYPNEYTQIIMNISGAK